MDWKAACWKSRDRLAKIEDENHLYEVGLDGTFLRKDKKTHTIDSVKDKSMMTRTDWVPSEYKPPV